MKNLTFAMWLVFILLWGCAKMPVYKSTWHQPVLHENENSQAWVDEMNYDLKSGIMYGLSNDNENLYVRMKFRNDVLRLKVMRAGLTFWIDTLGKKNKQLGLVFPIKSNDKGLPGRDERKPGQQTREPDRHIDTAIFNSKYRQGMETMQLHNYFGNGRSDLVDNQNDKGIKALLWIDEENILYYEAEISLKRIFPNPQKFLNDSTQYFSFGIETGKMEMPSMGNGNGRPQMGGGGSGGGGMRGMQGGGGQPGGSRGGQGMDSDRMAMMQAMSEESKVWIKKATLRNFNNSTNLVKNRINM